jgi:hypothetical protein
MAIERFDKEIDLMFNLRFPRIPSLLLTFQAHGNYYSERDDRFIDTPRAVWYTITSAHLHSCHLARVRGIQERVQNDRRVMIRDQTMSIRPPRKSTPPSI